jgi:hypothetical protein
MNITPFGTTTTEEINNLEAEFEITLPDDYKEFLQKHNGGKPEIKYAAFNVEDLEQDISLDIFFGIGIKELDILYWSNLFRDDILPESIIIGSDAGDGLLMLINDGENDGIYYWDHTFSFEQSSEENNLYFISNSFSEFIDSLKPL